jgi:hypothetical protein
MNCPATFLKNGTRVRTHETLGSMRGMMPTVEQLEARKPNVAGEIAGVAGGGGDIYWVKHDDGVLAPYCWSEFELADFKPKTAWEHISDAADG